MDKYPYTYYLTALMMGIFIYPHLFVPWVPLVSILTGALLLLFISLYYSKFRSVFSLTVLVFCFLTGLVLTKMNHWIPKNHYTHFVELEKRQFITIELEEQKNSNQKNKKYIAEVKSISFENKQIKTSGKILLFLDKEKYPDLSLGNTYQFTVKINKVRPALNPHQFDYKKYLERNYILYTGSVDKLISEKPHTSLFYKIKNSNQLLSKKVEASSLSFNSKEFLKAFLLGDRSEMKKENIQAYSKAGIMHLIAISGMHIAFIFGMIFSLFLFVFGRSRRKIIIILSLIIVWLFGCFVGLEASVFRSCLMITIYYFFELLKRVSNIYHSLSLSAVIILIFNPNELYSIGFQLSYIAVFSMVWLIPAFNTLLKSKNTKINNWVMKPLGVTFAAQLGTLPFVIFYFHQFSLLSIPANIFIIPYTYIITYSSVAELFIIFLPENIQLYFNMVYDEVVGILIKSTHFISSQEVFLFKNISLNLLELLSLTLCFVFVRNILLRFRMKYTFLLLICLLIFQMSRFIQNYQLKNKENFIVFSGFKHPVLGFRQGANLLILTDEEEDLSVLNSYILDSYITGERINNTEYKTLDYNKIYLWKTNKIQVLDKENNTVSENVDYLVSAYFSDAHTSLKKNIYTYFNKNLSEQDWNTKEQGAYIASP